jgi:hypothetical protein
MSARTCADCMLCCKVMAIEELANPAGRWCQHCRQGRGCLIYDDRPAECRAFSCLWLLDERFGPHWRPSKSKMVLTTSADGIEIRCDPGFPDAWRKQPFRSEIDRLAASGEMHDVTVLILAGERAVMVTGDREFDLGVVTADQRIVREMEGTRVVGMTVVESSEIDGT